MPEELPLNDKPPRVPITDARLLDMIQQLGGVGDALETLKKQTVSMPGMKLAISLIEVIFHERRASLLCRLYHTAQKAGVSADLWAVSGIKYDKHEPLVDLIATSEIDKE